VGDNPQQSTTCQKKGLCGDCRTKLHSLVVGLIAQEYVATIAFIELRAALAVQSDMQDLAYQGWTLAQSFSVAMGGYMLHFDGDYKPISAENFIEWQRSGTIRILRSTETALTEPKSIL